MLLEIVVVIVSCFLGKNSMPVGRKKGERKKESSCERAAKKIVSNLPRRQHNNICPKILPKEHIRILQTLAILD
jgi:hypothetical protein